MPVAVDIVLFAIKERRRIEFKPEWFDIASDETPAAVAERLAFARELERLGRRAGSVHSPGPHYASRPVTRASSDGTSCNSSRAAVPCPAMTAGSSKGGTSTRPRSAASCRPMASRSSFRRS